MIPRIIAYMLFEYKYFVQAYIRLSNYIDVLYLIYVAEIITSLNVISNSKLVHSAETTRICLYLNKCVDIVVYVLSCM